VDLWIKRDDLTGFALGGNKGRKLEFLLADIQDSGADIVVTCGSLQSNFIRQLSAACAVSGVRCAAAVMACPYEFEKPSAPPMQATGGNELLDRLLGLEMRVLPDGFWDDLIEEAESLACSYEKQGLKVYRMPIGGSSPLGAYAFLEAAKEMQAQNSKPFDAIVFASSSGSTHTGLALAFRGTSTRIVGVACDPEPQIADDFAKLSVGLEERGLGQAMKAEEYDLDARFVGPGYGVPSEGSLRAIETLSRAEGIFLDPVYSGKAFHGLLHMIEAGEVGGRILFWHTGGLPALFAMPTS
jgi:1-aminocyclopropane-1-carboxylate deaminase/D-cysteine desulfhydrase-like pyridoxal-dependent ACC family enzyme